MHSFPVLIIGASLVVSTLQLQCDPVTQYENGAKCCKMCGPGTFMVQYSNCENPECKPCVPGEYQDQYTTETKCNSQPYCDPNLNKEGVKSPTTTRRVDCNCIQGYHCSNKECKTCVVHTECEPGTEVKFEGNPLSDTVCQNCREGTFSPSKSSKCKEWTKCGPGFYIETKGTNQTDNICAKSPRSHMHLWIILAIILAAVVLFGFLYWLCRKNVTSKIVKQAFINEPVQEQPKKGDECILIDHKLLESDTISPEQESTQEESTHIMTPEENLEEDTGIFTENGNYVTQERGKSEILSRQESQTCTFTSSL